VPYWCISNGLSVIIVVCNAGLRTHRSFTSLSRSHVSDSGSAADHSRTDSV